MPLYDISNRTFHLPQKVTDKLAEFISKTVSCLEGSGAVVRGTLTIVGPL